MVSQLRESQATVESIRNEILSRTKVGPPLSVSVDIPLSDPSKRVLAFAAEEDGSSRHGRVGTGHLLLGLVREESLGAQVLRQHGLDALRVRGGLASGIPQPSADHHSWAGGRFERYTENARRVIFFARSEAIWLSSLYIEPEHLLLSLLRENRAVVVRFLESEKAIESIQNEIANQATARERDATAKDLPWSMAADRALSRAEAEAESLGHKHVDSEHILVGLTEHLLSGSAREESLAEKLLWRYGFDAFKFRQSVRTGT